MPPKRFLVYLGEAVDKAKIRKMSELMELSKDETTLLLYRFCDGLGIDQIADLHNISIARQKTMVPKLEEKVMSWIMDNFEFFNDRQIRAIYRRISSD